MGYHGCGEEYNLVKSKKGKGKQIHLPYEIAAVRKNIQWGRRNGKDKSRFKKKNDERTLYTFII